jgi:glycerol-3-phosphate acyltransferase PlsY
MSLSFIILIVFAYLLGSIPFGLLIAKFHNIDLRSIGSGNIGATNVSRALGKRWAYVCFVLDALKVLVPMLLAKPSVDELNILTLSLWLAVGCAAILGHIFPIYLSFKGGKGMSTCLGIVLGLFPYYTVPGLIAFVIWAVCLLIWRYMSLASLIAACSFPIVLIAAILLRPTWHITNLWPLIVVALAIPVLVVIRHVENIKRLLEGSESKVMQKKGSSA